MLGALWGIVYRLGVHRKALKYHVQPGQQAALVTVTQRELYLTTADREVHVHAGGCLRQGRRRGLWLRWLARCLSVAVRASAQLPLHQCSGPLLHASGNAMLAPPTRSPWEVFALTRAVTDHVLCRAVGL